MPRFDILFRQGKFDYSAIQYRDQYSLEITPTARIVIDVEVGENVVECIVDTGAPWCVLNPQVIAPLIADGRAEYVSPLRYFVRGYAYDGALFRVSITLRPQVGEDVPLDATVFVPTLDAGEQWINPNFIGLDGCLSRIWFTVDPAENMFYFGAA